MTELQEIAHSLYPIAPRFEDFEAARRWVALQMPGEGESVKDNVADYLMGEQEVQS